MKRTGMLAFVFFVFILFVISGCKKSESGKIVLRCAYWGDVKEIKIINNSVNRFKKENPEIDVKLERLPSGDPYIEKMLTQIAGGTPPDVMFVEEARFAPFAERGVFLSLNKFIEKEKFPINDYYKELVNAFTIDGNIYVLPRDIAPICVVYYNKNLFDEEGIKYPVDDWTWNDLLEKAKRLTKVKSKGIKIFGFADDWPLWDAFVLSNGGRYVDNPKNPARCLLDSKKAIEAIKFRRDLIYKYKVMPSPSNLSAMGGVGAGDLFMQGKVAMFYSGIWKTPIFRDIRKFKWDAVMFPRGPGGKRGFPMSGSGYAILKTTKYPEDAWKLVKFLAGEKGQIELAETGLAQPAIIKIAKSPHFIDNKPPVSKKFLLKAVKYGVFPPATSSWIEALNMYILPGLDKVWTGEKEPEEILPEIVKEVNKRFFKKSRSGRDKNKNRVCCTD